MTKLALKALKGSIEHWKRMATGKRRMFEGISDTHCELCGLFLDSSDVFECIGCPVRQETGESGCKGTPYHHAHDAWQRWGLDSKGFKKAARAELKFLLGLLPKRRAT
jgi:hypothetical protein